MKDLPLENNIRTAASFLQRNGKHTYESPQQRSSTRAHVRPNNTMAFRPKAIGKVKKRCSARRNSIKAFNHTTLVTIKHYLLGAVIMQDLRKTAAAAAAADQQAMRAHLRQEDHIRATVGGEKRLARDWADLVYSFLILCCVDLNTLPIRSCFLWCLCAGTNLASRRKLMVS